MSDIWDKIGALTPTTDAAIASSGGDHWEAKVDLGARWHSHAPLPMKPFDGLGRDFTGARFGSLTVLGLVGSDDRTGAWKLRAWVVRCVCGDYETRRQKSIRKSVVASSVDDACGICSYTRAMLARDKSSKGPKPSTLRRDAERLDEIATLNRAQGRVGT